MSQLHQFIKVDDSALNLVLIDSCFSLFALFHQVFDSHIQARLVKLKNVVRDDCVTIVAVCKLFLLCWKMLGGSKKKAKGYEEESSQRTMEHNI